MKKIKIILILIILFGNNSNTIYGQDIINEISTVRVDEMSDDQVASYWETAQAKGYTMSQLESIAKLKGMPASEVLKLKKRILALKNKNNKEREDAEEPEEFEEKAEFGHTGKEEVEIEKSNHFGMNFFSNPIQN